MKKYWWIAALVVAVDQLSKFLMQSVSEPIVLLPGIFQLRYAQNTGMAFSMLSGQPWLLAALSVLLVAGGWLIMRKHRLGPVSKVGAMLVLGGAVGNLIDRLLRGYVVDMFEVLFVRFAVFNVADSALCVGCGLIALTLIAFPDDWREKA